MKHGEEADLGAQMFGIGGNGAQGFRCGPEEKVVQHFFVLVIDGGNLFRPLGARQGLTLWAMAVSARVVANTFVPRLIALFLVSAESGSPAQFDRTQDPALRRGQRNRMLFTIGFAVATKHVRDFQLGTIHGPVLRSTEEWPVWSRRERGAVTNRAGSTSSTLCWSQCADDILRWWPAAMSQAAVECADVGALFEEVDGDGVAPIYHAR